MFDRQRIWSFLKGRLPDLENICILWNKNGHSLCVFQVLCQPRPPPTTNPTANSTAGTLTQSRSTPSRSLSSRSGSSKQIKRIESEGLALIVAAGFLYDTPCNRFYSFIIIITTRDGIPESNVFSRVCLSTGVPIWPLPMMHWTLLYSPSSPNPSPSPLPSASDSCLSRLKTSSKVKTCSWSNRCGRYTAMLSDSSCYITPGLIVAINIILQLGIRIWR